MAAAAPDPLSALTPREVREVIDPLRRIRAAVAGSSTRPEEAIDMAIRRVSLGLLRLSHGPDLDLGEPAHFVESQQ